jgi:hypothetical protein
MGYDAAARKRTIKVDEGTAVTIVPAHGFSKAFAPWSTRYEGVAVIIIPAHEFVRIRCALEQDQAKARFMQRLRRKCGRRRRQKDSATPSFHKFYK